MSEKIFSADDGFGDTSRRCDRCDGTGPHFCAPRAQRVVDVFEKILVHTKSDYAKKPFLLEPWQRDDIIAPLFGTVKWSDEKDKWVRQYKIAWIELARKNGKSELLAGIALVLLIADDEEGAEIYSCAQDRDQARKVFDVAERMVQLSDLLSSRLKVYKQQKRIVDEKTGSYYEVLSGQADGNLGHNPSGILFDEVLTQPNDKLWNTMRTAMGARSQPLMVAATTAGNDPSGFCAAEHTYCERVQEDPELDPSRFVYLRNVPKDADWEDENNWYIANPALGRFLSIDALRDEFREAKNAPAKENAFRQFRLNQWVQQASRWINLDMWDSSGKDWDEERSTECWGGLDLASSIDIAAFALCFPEPDGVFRFEWRFWLPEERVNDLDARTGGQGSVWAREGWLTLTEGNVIDYTYILEEIESLRAVYNLREIAYDKWGMTQLSQDLMSLSIDAIPTPQTAGYISPPSKEFERLVLDGKIVHGNNPVMRWMMNNVTVYSDPSGNIKPSKQHSGDKIDGVVAAIMALDRAIKKGGRKQQYKLVGW